MDRTQQSMYFQHFLEHSTLIVLIVLMFSTYAESGLKLALKGTVFQYLCVSKKVKYGHLKVFQKVFDRKS